MSNLFDVAAFKNKLTTQWLGRSICYVKELDSTNSFIKRLPRQEVDQGMLCLAENQRKGRGQYERKWKSDAGKNLTFSLGFQPRSSEGFHVLTLACALAITEQLNEAVSDVLARIKWPNDVLLKDKKVAGLLTETVFNGNKPDRLIIGIGLNVNQDQFPAALTQKATSLYRQTGKKVSREDFLCELLTRIEYHYYSWHRRQQDLVKSINRNIIGYGRWVGLKIDDELYDDTYKMLGINEAGKLLMLNQEGGIESFSYEQIRLVTD